MIVIEGPDGCGKTTLIKEIQTQFPVTLAPRVVGKDTRAIVDLVKWVEEDNEKLSQGVVYDRHRLISEVIYGPVMRDFPEKGFDDLDWLTLQMRLFYRKKPVIFYCLPPRDVMHENLRDDPDNEVVWTKAHQIYDLYVTRAALDIGCGRAYLYDYTSTPLKLVMSTISREEMF